MATRAGGESASTESKGKGRAERIRAQAACVTCRSRRTKCVVEEGETACNYCKSHDRECVIINDDLRKKRVTQDYVSSLENRIKELEAALHSAGQDVPPPGATVSKHKSTTGSQTTGDQDSVPDNLGEEQFGAHNVRQATLDPMLEALSESPATNITPSGTQTVASAIYEILIPCWNYNRAPVEDVGNGAGVEFLNTCKRAVVARSALAMENDGPPASTEILDTLRNQAKDFYDSGNAHPAHPDVVFGLILLADLEFRAGFAENSWIYLTHAWDVLRDFAVPKSSNLDSDTCEEVCTLFVSCLIYSRIWTNLRNRRFERFPQGYEFTDLAERHGLAGHVLDVYNSHKTMSTTLSAWLHLVAAEVRWQHLMDFRRPWAATQDAAQFIEADADMGSWYMNLPEPLRWLPDNISNANASFFFLHIYYHSRLILMHWHAATYNVSVEGSIELEEEGDIMQCMLSREVCWKNAMRVWRVAEEYRTVFPIRNTGLPVLQAILVAAAAVIANVEKNFKPYEGDGANSLRDILQMIEEVSIVCLPAHDYARQLSDAINCLEAGRPVDFSSQPDFQSIKWPTLLSQLLECTTLIAPFP